MSQNERGAVGLLDNFGHGEGFTTASDAQQHLVSFVIIKAFDQLSNGGWLIT